MKTKHKTFILSLLTVFSIAAIAFDGMFSGHAPADLEYILKIRLKPKDVYSTPADATIAYARDKHILRSLDLPLTNSIDLYAYVCYSAGMVVTTCKVSWLCSNPCWTLKTAESGEKTTVTFGASGIGTIFATVNFNPPDKSETKKLKSVLKINVAPDLPPHIFEVPILPKSPAPCVTQTFIDLRWGHNDNNNYAHTSAGFENRKKYYSRMFAFVTLQGLVNRVQPRLYQVDSWYQLWASRREDYMLSFYTNKYNMVFNEEKDLYSLIKKFAKPPEVKSVIIYPDSLFSDHDKGDLVNYMTALCSVSNCIALSIEDYKILTNKYDFSMPVLEILNDKNCAQRGLTNSPAIYNYMIENFWPLCSRRAIAHVHPLLFQVNRDYFIAHKIFPFFYRRDFKEMYNEFDTLLKEMPINATILGSIGDLKTDIRRYCRYGGLISNTINGKIKVTTKWLFMEPIPFHDIIFGRRNSEEGFYLRTSKLGKTAQYMLGIANTSFHSGFDGNNISFKQNINTNIIYDPNKVYMCSFMSDGGNMDYSKNIFYNRWIRNGVATNNYVGLGFNLLLYDLAPDILDFFYKNKGDKISINAETGAGNMENSVYGTGIKFNRWSSTAKKDFALKSYLKLTREYLKKLDIRVIRPNFMAKQNDFYVYAKQLSGVIDALGPSYYAKFHFKKGTVQDMQKHFVIKNDVVFLWDDWAHKIQKRERKKPEIWVDKNAKFPQFHSCWFQYCHGWYDDWLDIQHLKSKNNKVKLVPPIVFQKFYRKSKGIK